MHGQRECISVATNSEVNLESVGMLFKSHLDLFARHDVGSQYWLCTLPGREIRPEDPLDAILAAWLTPGLFYLVVTIS